MKQLLFSRVFPKTHPRAGEPTRFPEAIWAGLKDQGVTLKEIDATFFDMNYYLNCPRPKYHTIRAGHRWKVGDRFMPRVWSGIPYRSPTITFGPVLEVKKTWEIEIWPNGHVIIERKVFGELLQPGDNIIKLASNDGLRVEDLQAWFRTKEVFRGQIICWSDKIEY